MFLWFKFPTLLWSYQLDNKTNINYNGSKVRSGSPLVLDGAKMLPWEFLLNKYEIFWGSSYLFLFWVVGIFVSSWGSNPFKGGCLLLMLIIRTVCWLFQGLCLFIWDAYMQLYRHAHSLINYCRLLKFYKESYELCGLQESVKCCLPKHSGFLYSIFNIWQSCCSQGNGCFVIYISFILVKFKCVKNWQTVFERM